MTNPVQNESFNTVENRSGAVSTANLDLILTNARSLRPTRALIKARELNGRSGWRYCGVISSFLSRLLARTTRNSSSG